MRTIDDLFTTLYDTLSGPAGPRDWERLRPLYYPGAIMTRVTLSDDGRPSARLMTFDQYIEATAPFLESKGFYEVETDRRVDHFGNVAHAESTYESRWALDDPPFMTGTNSVQLYHDGQRWWILSVAWDNGRFARLLIDD